MIKKILIKALPKLALTLCFASLVVSCSNTSIKPAVKTEKYQASWESLSQHEEVPEWLRDAKLGIYFHWGVYSVPEKGNEWYPRSMNQKNKSLYKFHTDTYGDPKEFGYHHLIPLFKAPKFDAKAMVSLFKEAGARFVGPVAQHHDGFAMWDSDVNPWNSADMGPKKDIVGDITQAAREQGLKTIVTFHHARLLQRNADKPDRWRDFNSHYPYDPELFTSTTDPKLRLLYGNIPEAEFNLYWENQFNEVVDNYRPDMVWFDTWYNYIPEDIRQRSLARYLNRARDQKQAVAIGYKQNDLPLSVGINDIEQGGRRDLIERTWMTDLTLSKSHSWSYVEGQKYRSPSLLIRNIIDVVSKNGIVLLNVSPRADGSIPQVQQDTLRELGRWLAVHGEAIYNTKPWDMFGWGMGSNVKDGSLGGQDLNVQYSAKDIRITQSKDEKTIYLFFLGQLEPGKKRYFLLGHHQYRPKTDIKQVSVVGSGESIDFELGHAGLILHIPDVPMNEHATVLKMELE